MSEVTEYTAVYKWMQERFSDDEIAAVVNLALAAFQMDNDTYRPRFKQGAAVIDNVLAAMQSGELRTPWLHEQIQARTYSTKPMRAER